MIRKTFSVSVFILMVSTCYADSLDEMRRENEQRMDAMADRIREENYLSEIRRANDQQERYNRHIIESQKRNSRVR